MNNYKGGDTLNLNAESSNNELIGEIIVQFFREREIPIKIIKLEKNHISSFRIGSSSNNNNLLNEYYEIGVSYFESVTHIFPFFIGKFRNNIMRDIMISLRALLLF